MDEKSAKPDLLTAPQLASELQVSEWSVRQKTLAGLIPAIRIGKSVRYEREAVIAALRAQAAS